MPPGIAGQQQTASRVLFQLDSASICDRGGKVKLDNSIYIRLAEQRNLYCRRVLTEEGVSHQLRPNLLDQFPYATIR
jgi:hypothetical protein